MEQPSAAAFLELVAARRGHFRLESSHHSDLWLELDGLFVEPRRVEPFVAALTAALRPYAVDAVCGPLLGGAFLAQLVAHALGARFLFAERGVPAQAGRLYAVSYQLPPALAAGIAGQRVALVDDVLNAGSALGSTYAALAAHGAVPVVAGALLVLGTTGSQRLQQLGVPVESVAAQPYALWAPPACPLCAAAVPLDDPAAPPREP